MSFFCKAVFVAAFAFAARGGLGSELASDGDFGIGKVVKMLKDLSAKAIRGKNDEKVAFAKSSTVCEKQTSQIDADIKKAKEQIKVLDAEIEKATLDAQTLGEEADKLSKTMEEKSSELELKTKSRSEDYATFMTKSNDLHESVDQLTRAHATLKSAARNMEGTKASVLVQLHGATLLEQRTLEALLALRGSDPSTGSGNISLALLARAAEPGAADAYKSQSGGVVQTLETLRDDAAAELKELQTKESKARHDEELVIQQLQMSVTNAKRSRAKKLAAKTQRESKVAFDKKQLASTQEDQAASEKLLKTTKSECQEAADEFKNNQQTRQEEIDALDEATKLLESSDVSTAKKHLDFTQRGQQTASALIQISSLSAGKETAWSHHRLRLYLEAQAKRLGSKSLALLLQRMAADPFAKVTGMIKDMLARLEEEAQKDQTQEAFCDLEVAKNKQSRTQLSEDVDQLASKIEDGKASLALLKREINILSDEIDELVVARNQSKELRKKEQDENTAIVEDSVVAEKAVAKAIKFLKDFYEKAKPTTTPKPLTIGDLYGLAASSDPYTGLQAESGGVLAMLEVVRADFETAAKDAKAAEEKSKTKHKEFMIQSRESKDVKEKAVSLRKDDKAAMESELKQNEAALETTNQEFKAAQAYAEKLEGQCVDKGTSYKERAAARQAELQSLKEALQMLSD